MTNDERFQKIAEQLRAGDKPDTVTARQLVGWFGYERRVFYVVALIRASLNRAGIRTVPDFDSVWLDATLSFELKPSPPADGEGAPPTDGTDASGSAVEGGLPAYGEDPTYRIGKLPAANRPPLSVPLDCPLELLVTRMLLYKADWVVVKSGERDVRGMVTWRTIGRQLALKQACGTAGDCMEPALTVDPSTSLFQALPTIVTNGYVLVQDKTKEVLGMVTTHDLSDQFSALSEPFLLLGEIENHLRSIISSGNFTKAELIAAKDPNDGDRKIEGIADLTFGEYVRFIEDEKRWVKLGLAVSRAEVVKQLQEIRTIRNDVMHFEPDPLGEESLTTLRRFTQFLRELADARGGSAST